MCVDVLEVRVDRFQSYGIDHIKGNIVSSHNFKGAPRHAELEKVFKNALEKGAGIVKIAAKADSLDDVNRLMQFTARHKKHNVITMSLGSIGSISRLTFPSAGSLLTYSYAGRPSAPGQIPLDVLQEHLRLYYPEYNQHFIDELEAIENGFNGVRVRS